MCGGVAYYKNMDPKKTKLDPRGIKCDFVYYAPNGKAYKLLNLESDVIIEFEMWNSLRILSRRIRNLPQMKNLVRNVLHRFLKHNMKILHILLKHNMSLG